MKLKVITINHLMGLPVMLCAAIGFVYVFSLGSFIVFPYWVLMGNGHDLYAAMLLGSAMHGIALLYVHGVFSIVGVYGDFNTCYDIGLQQASVLVVVAACALTYTYW